MSATVNWTRRGLGMTTNGWMIVPGLWSDGIRHKWSVYDSQDRFVGHFDTVEAAVAVAR